MSTFTIAAMLICVVLGLGALALLFWLALRPDKAERERAKHKREQLRLLDEAEKKFGNPWGGHG